MFVTIGNATINFDQLIYDLPTIVKKEAVTKNLRNYAREVFGSNIATMRKVESAYETIFNHHPQGWIRSDEYEQKGMESLRDMLLQQKKYIEDYDAAYRCLYVDDTITLVTLGGTVFLLPSEYVTVEEYADYDTLNAEERRRMLADGAEYAEGNTALACGGKSRNEALKDKESLSDKLNELYDDIEHIEERDPELAALKTQMEEIKRSMEEKKNALMAELDKRKADLEAQKKKLEFDIYRLESEIYSIRCYMGESVDFVKVLSGSPAQEDTPLVIYQKLRYMDEELGKLASIYNVDFSDARVLEDLIRHDPLARDTFAPTERSVLFVKVSKSGTAYYPEAYGNTLEAVKKYRGKSIGIVIRDGENVFIGWTDEEKISFTEDAFFNPGVGEAKPEIEKKCYERDEDYAKRVEDYNLKMLHEAVSRSFVFTMLQGIIDRHIIVFPEPIKVNRPSPYIVRSYADGWIEDNRYGTLDEMFKRCNANIRKGDQILTLQNLRPEAQRDWQGRYMGETWYNDRGRGDRNRTHDVRSKNNTIYPINMVEKTYSYSFDVTYPNKPGETFKSSHAADTKAEMDEFLKDHDSKNGHYSYIVENVNVTSVVSHYFISLHKEYSRSDNARANFEVYDGEFVNLTYLNSKWLEYVLTTHKTGSINIGGEYVDFAHVIPYLKNALAFVRKREEQERKVLEQYAPEILRDAEWPAQLTEWKLATGCRSITESERTTKRFAKWYDDNHGVYREDV